MHVRFEITNDRHTVVLRDLGQALNVIEASKNAMQTFIVTFNSEKTSRFVWTLFCPLKV